MAIFTIKKGVVIPMKMSDPIVGPPGRLFKRDDRTERSMDR